MYTDLTGRFLLTKIKTNNKILVICSIYTAINDDTTSFDINFFKNKRIF